MVENRMLFPFYDDLQSQFRFKNNCGNDVQGTFIVPPYTLPSFFFVKEKRPWQIASFLVKDLNGTTVATIPLSHLQSYGTTEWDAVGYHSRLIRRTEDAAEDGYENWLLPCGYYYIELREAQYPTYGKAYFSEVFRVIEEVPVLTDGNELVLNGRFSGTMASWTTNGNWDATTGVAQYTGGGGGFILNQILGGYQYDKRHMWRITFTITNYNNGGNAARYLRVYSNGLDTENNVKVTGNGTYTWYVNRASRIYIQQFGGFVTFDIDNISVQKIIGWEGYVSVLADWECKFPNNIDPDNHWYYNLLLFDALMLAPEYGEERVENENGHLRDYITFLRTFKSYSIRPMLLPEPVVDAVAILNKFDYAEIYDGHGLNYFELLSETRQTLAKGFNSFDTKVDWQEKECYALVNLGFTENTGRDRACCDGEADLTPCFDDETVVELKITPYPDHLVIELANNPTGLEGTWVMLFLLQIATGDYTDCESIFEQSAYPLNYLVPWEEFAANGITYYADNLYDYAYQATVLITQFGCSEAIVTEPACLEPAAFELLALSKLECCSDPPECIGFITIEYTANIAGYPNDGSVTLQYFSGNLNMWVPLLGGNVYHGTNTANIFTSLDIALCEFRLHDPATNTFSAVLNLSPTCITNCGS